jgi:phenolic acid decarboxylase
VAQSQGGQAVSDTIILDSKKCNAELLTIHADGRITVAVHLKPTETAAKVLQIMREQWLADIQSKKIREQEDHIKRLEEAGDAMEVYCDAIAANNWLKAKEAKP